MNVALYSNPIFVPYLLSDFDQVTYILMHNFNIYKLSIRRVVISCKKWMRLKNVKDSEQWLAEEKWSTISLPYQWQ